MRGALTTAIGIISILVIVVFFNFSNDLNLTGNIVKGYCADVVFVYRKGRKYSHALVRVINGGIYYLDPVTGDVSENLESYKPDFTWVLPYKELYDRSNKEFW